MVFHLVCKSYISHLDTLLNETLFFAVNKVRVPVLPFLLFSYFLSLSRLPNTPLRMTTQRMVGKASSSLKRTTIGQRFGGNARSSVFNARIYGCLGSCFSLRLKSLKHALFNVYLASFLGSMDTFTRSIEAQLVVSC